MRLVQIDVTFLGASTFSGHLPDGGAEWPPAPARVFAALVAGAGSTRTEGTQEALTALEVSAAPIIVAESGAGASPVVPHYTNRTTAAAPLTKKVMGSALLVGASGLGSPDGGSSAEPFGDVRTVAFPVSYLVAVDDADQVSSGLATAAAQVSYMGRSWDSAVVSVQVVDAEEPSEYAAALAGSTRQVWVPSIRGTELRSWSSGLLATMDAAFDSDSGRYTPACSPVRYRKSWDTGSESGILAAHLERPVTGRAISRLAERLPEHARVSVSPGSDRAGGRVAYCYTVGDVDSLDERITQVESALEGIDFEWDTPPASLGRYLDACSTWRSEVPVSAPGPADYAADLIAVGVARAADIEPSQVHVKVTPDVDHYSGVTVAPCGQRLWSAAVTTDVPVTGPLTVGSTAVGTLVTRRP